MTRKKLQRFAEVLTFPNYICPRENPEISVVDFLGDGPYTLEIGCGSGVYTLALAGRFPEKTVVGIDVKAARIYYGARDALRDNIHNAKFMRAQAELLGDYLPEGSVADIWLTFPDPFLQNRRSHKRLTSERFMKMYKELLVPGGSVHLKTDSLPLFLFTLEEWERVGVKVLEKYEDIYAMVERGEEVPEILTGIQTKYEKEHLAGGRKIYYVRGGW